MKVAIIGGGIAGLTAAWQLNQAGIPVTVYDSALQLGGNAQTRKFIIANEDRFCDLGVNDFNANTYTNIVNMLNQLNIPYALLEDSACFYDPDGTYGYTIGDGAPYRQMSSDMAQEFTSFQQNAPAFLAANPAKAATMTIQDYLTYGGYSDDFANNCILPRVNAMYFVSDQVPAGQTPFVAVMHYYTLQEGFGTPNGPKRMYFQNGAQPWIWALSDATQAGRILDTNVVIQFQNPGWMVTDGEGGNTEFYDTLIFACHASQIAALYPNPPPALQPAFNLLPNFPYANSTAYAHTYAPALPADVNLWRTYNVMILDHTAPQPYSMTYVCNRHQNDEANPPLDYYGGPQFFVSLNPPVAIPDEYQIAPPWSFPHNILSFTSMQAQQDLNQYQGPNGLYFTGGWCYHAGLHEECWIHASAVAQSIISGQPFVPPPDYSTGQAPPHILRALGRL
jgi:predicted NAD/FAD-binding protein